MRDFRQALRALLRTPGFTFVVVLTLGLSLAANTAIFSVVHAVLLQPLPFKDPGRLVRIYNHPKGNTSQFFEASYANFQTWRKESHQLADIAGYASSAGGLLVDIDGTLLRVEGKMVSWNLFSLLGVQPLLGRPLEEVDDVPGAAPVAVISERLWRQRFGGDPAAVGKTIKVEGVPCTIVSVMPADFEFPVGSRIWIPVATSLPAFFLETPTLKFFNLLGRLSDGATPDQAHLELNTIIDTVTNPQLPEPARSEATLGSLREDLVGDTKGPLWFLLGAALLVLLIACANVANLQTVRAIARQRELAMRTALGASWRHLAQQSLAESAVLSLLGGVLGVLLAWWGVHQLLKLSPETFFRAESIGLNPAVLLFALGLTVLAAVVFGLVPAWYAVSRTRISQALQESAGRSTGGVAGRRLLSGFVMLQVALAVTLLIGAGLLLRSFATLQQVDVGFSREGVLTLSVPLLTEKYQQPGAAYRFFDELIERAKAQGEIQGAAAVLLRPLQSLAGYDYTMTIEGRPEEEQQKYPFLNFEAVTPDYFQVMGVPLKEGRAFTAADREDSAGVVILSQAVAELLWPDSSPVGARVKWGGPENQSPWLEVIGVVGDGRYRGIEKVTLNVYVPYRQSEWGLNHLVVRTSGNPRSVLGTLRAQISDLDPELQPTDVATTGELISRALARPRFNTVLIGVFALLALILGAVGLYGVMSYLVALRTNEIGIRMAMGAVPAAILRMALSQALRLALVGVVVGLVVSVLLVQLLRTTLAGVLYEVSVTDPLTFIGVPLVLLLVALVAGLVPALRASRVDPLVALRMD